MRRIGLATALLIVVVALLVPARSAEAATRADAPSAAGATTALCGTPGAPTTTVFLPNITKTLGGSSGWVTPFIVQNVGVKRATLEVSFFRFSDGGLVACRKVSDLAPATSFADFPNADEDLPADSQFAVVVRSFGSEIVSVVNEHRGIGTAQPEALSYDGLASGATTVYLPFVGKPEAAPCTAVPPTEATCDLRWLTTFVMQNFGAVDATVTARFVSYDGGATATLTRTIAPGRSRFIDPSVEPQVRAGRYYSVVLTSTQPVGVIANDHDDAAGSAAPRGFSYNGIAQPVAGDAFLPYVRRDAGFREYANGVLIQNAGRLDAVPTLSFQRLGGGAPVSLSSPSPLKPGASWYFDPDASPLPAGEYSLVVSGGAFAVVGTALAPGSAMAYVGVAAQGNRAYLPNVTRTLGGPSGWSTPILIQSSGATSATLRWYRFSDGALITRQTIGPLARGSAIRVDPRSVAALANDTQYGVVVDAQGGNIAAIVTELDFAGGDGTMAYEGFSATVSTVPTPTAVTLAPGAVRIGTDETAQLTVTVKDQFDEVMPQQLVTWTAVPTTLGTVTPGGLFTAGSGSVDGTISASVGSASDTIIVTVQAPTPVTVGGISFLLRTTGSTDVYAETTISRSDAASISTQLSADVGRIQADYATSFSARPAVYVLGSDSSYTTAQTAILGIAPAFVSSPDAASPFETAGVYYAKKVAVDWARTSAEKPFSTGRHELTHMIIDEISGDAVVPAWLNEGSARLEEFTVPGAKWLEARETSEAVSMAATNQLFTLDELSSQFAWNTRLAPASLYQYAEAQEVVQLLRSEVGIAGEVAILRLLGSGQTFDTAYEAYTARTAASFAESAPARIRAVASSPGIAFAPDSIAGTGVNGPTFVLYGWAPSSVVTISIVGARTGASNGGRLQQIDSYGVYWSRLGTAWPADTYTFTVTSSTGLTVIRTITKT